MRRIRRHARIVQVSLAVALAVTGAWDWPTPAPHSLSRVYIAPATVFGPGHRGIDIRASGDVRAPADGVVHFVGVVVDRPVLSIEHDGGLLSSFEPVTSELHSGDTVRRGEIIGRIEPGHCLESCVHFGVRLNGEYVSPLALLGGLQRSVLLPTRRIG